MIKITRIEIPTVLANNATNWTNAYLQAKEEQSQQNTEEDKKKTKKIVKEIEKKYNHKDVKKSLKIMFNNKCAFCESYITHIDYGQIEHFKPKTKYPELCFEWTNFLLSCSVCNGKSNKGEHFPTDQEGGPLINPVNEDPDDFFKFEYDDITKQFLLLPKNERANTMLKIIKLNREDLAEKRTLDLSKIINLIMEIIQNKPEKITLLEQEFSIKDEYYAFINTIFERLKTSNP